MEDLDVSCAQKLFFNKLRHIWLNCCSVLCKMNVSFPYGTYKACSVTDYSILPDMSYFDVNFRFTNYITHIHVPNALNSNTCGVNRSV